MERLTERDDKNIIVKEDYGENVLRTIYECYGKEVEPHYANCEEGYCAMEKLAKYEDLEEQGLLVKLQFSVGNRVFALWNTESRYVIYEAEVKEICIGTYNARKNIKYMIESIDRRGNLFKYYSEDVGKFLFIDKQQADQALKEMEGAE